MRRSSVVRAALLLTPVALAPMAARADDAGHWRLQGVTPSTSDQPFGGGRFSAKPTGSQATLGFSDSRIGEFVALGAWTAPPDVIVPGRELQFACEVTRQKDDFVNSFMDHYVQIAAVYGKLNPCGEGSAAETTVSCSVGSHRDAGPVGRSAKAWIPRGDRNDRIRIVVDLSHCAGRIVYDYGWVAGPPPAGLSQTSGRLGASPSGATSAGDGSNGAEASGMAPGRPASGGASVGVAPTAEPDPGRPPIADDSPGADLRAETVIVRIASDGSVSAGPSAPTIFHLDTPTLITRLWTYHWNGGRGAEPGSISLVSKKDGATVGTWPVVATHHMFATTPGVAWPKSGDGPPFLYWTVSPAIALPGGDYEVRVSSPETWAHNEETGHRGVVIVHGVPGQ